MNNANSNEEEDVFEDALEEPERFLHRSTSFESLRTFDSEVSDMSVWLEPVQGQGVPPQACLTTLTPSDPLHHPLQSLIQKNSPLSSGTSHSSLLLTESNDIHGNSLNNNTSTTDMQMLKAVPVKTKTKGKLGAAFQKVHLIQELQDKEFPIQGAIFCLCFSPDGHYLAAAGVDKVIRIWSLKVKDALLQQESSSHPKAYSVQLFKPDPISRY